MKTEIKMKLAVQAAYELRSCPDSNTLYNSVPDDNLKRHLDICTVCREKLDMQKDERLAWQAVRGKFLALAIEPEIEIEKQPGQVWAIKKEFGGWREDGRFVRPPVVVLLDNHGEFWNVSQTYWDKQMMNKGDVPLDDRFGFAQSWNCYTITEDMLDHCLGGTRKDELHQINVEKKKKNAVNNPLLEVFRQTEIEVGFYLSSPIAIDLMGW